MPETDSSMAAGYLTRDILAGALPPRQRLKLRELSDRYEIGPTPLREALSRLAARGLVEQEGQRGFRVPPVTRYHLMDITHTRQVIEAEAFRLAVGHGGRTWEDEVSAAIEILRRAILRQDATEDWLDDYEDRHHRFHRALIAACPFATLRTYCDELYEQKTRYRRFLRSLGSRTDGVLAAHEQLAAFALARDAEGGAIALREHIGMTAAGLATVLGAD